MGTYLVCHPHWRNAVYPRISLGSPRVFLHDNGRRLLLIFTVEKRGLVVSKASVDIDQIRISGIH